MIALHISLAVTAVLGLVLSYFEFRRSRHAYRSWVGGGQNGLGLQVAAHQVRVAVANVVIHCALVLFGSLGLIIFWSGWREEQLTLVLFSGLSILSLLFMMKQLMYRYDYALIVDHAVNSVLEKERSF